MPASRTSYVYREVHMGLPVRMVMAAPDEATARRAAAAAFTLVGALDGRLSDYRIDSDLRAIERAAPDAVQVHPEVYAVIARAVEIARASDGAFDPTVAPVVALWRESRRTGRLPDRDALAVARGLVGWSRIALEKTSGGFFVRLPLVGMRLDLGGIAKGYILQRAIETLRDQGVPRAMIEAGGDIVTGDARAGARGWMVQVSAECGVRSAGWRSERPGPERPGLERPGSERPGFSPAVVLRNEALATSGATAQVVEIAGVRYSHIVDPTTGLGLTRHPEVHVRAKDGATADAWATALGVIVGRGLQQQAARLDRAALGVPDDVEFCIAK